MDDFLFDVFSQTALLVDTETTGLTLEDEMVEIGLLLFQFDRDTGEIMEIKGEYSGLREPKITMNKEAQAVHGIPFEQLKGKEFDDAKVKELIAQTEVFIAHNVEFDRPFVTKMYPEAGEKDWYCSMSGVAWKKKGFINRKLQYLIKEHQIEIGQAHRALDDVKGTYDLLCKKDKDSGKPYLVELMQNGPFRV
jgi:DNA polymerase-3 subunit epsilon